MVPNSVRVIYIEPKDAEAWLDARRRATELLEDLHHFFADEMNRHGFGPRTFAFAGDDEAWFDYRKSTTLSKAEFQADPWKSCKRELGGGRPPDAPDIEICFFDAYSIVDGVVSCPGVFHTHRRCYINALLLKTAIREWLEDQCGYRDRVFSWISPHALAEATLSWNGRGPSLGDVAGAGFGVIAHELDHAFGGKHHPSQDDERERRGHLMGLGSRGFRGYFRPDLTNDRCVLSKIDAASLSTSQFIDVRELKPKGKHFFAA